MITPDQIRAARALKGWSQTELANRANVAVPSIANIELGKQKPSAQLLDKIYEAFLLGGVEFTPNEGVQKRVNGVVTFRGRSGFLEFVDDVDVTARMHNGAEFLVCNVDEVQFMKWQSQDVLDDHAQNILDAGVKYKIIIKAGDSYMPASSYAEYRWADEGQFYSVPLYIYGDKVGFIAFEDDDVNVFVVQNQTLSDLCRKQFNEMWVRAVGVRL